MNWPTKKLVEILSKFEADKEPDIFCVVCNTPKIGSDRFCKKCNKETNNLFKKELTVNSKMNISLMAKQKRPGFGLVKKFFQGFKPSKDPKLSDGVDVLMIVDREKNEYHHIVKDNKTGRLIHDEHELLTGHRSRYEK